MLDTNLETAHALALDPTSISHPVSVSTEAAADSMSLVVFSSDLDRLLAAMTMATGAAAMGTQVTLFFTFWATSALRVRNSHRKRSFIERVLGWMLPKGFSALRLSSLDFGGLGTRMMRWRMRSKRVAGLDELLEHARELGVRIRVCEMSMDLLGMQMDDLVDYPDMQLCGVSTFMSHATTSKVTMFV
jgi:peroxiredoxin family protein